MKESKFFVGVPREAGTLYKDRDDRNSPIDTSTLRTYLAGLDPYGRVAALRLICLMLKRAKYKWDDKKRVHWTTALRATPLDVLKGERQPD